MIDRRTLVAGAAALAAVPAVAAPRAKVGIQLYTLRDLFARDPEGTLTQLARIGYREVEYGGGGYDAMDPRRLRAATDRLDLSAPSVHIGLEALTSRFDQSAAMAKALGADTVVLPWLDANQRGPEAWRTVVAGLNPLARRLRERGLGFAYHNHDFEFAALPGGGTPYDRLIGETDPKLVQLELDLFWAVKAGQDAAALIRRLAGRVYAYHVKDMTAAGQMTSVGAGRIDFAALFRLNRTAGVRHFYVENDEAPVPYWPDVTASFTTLNRLLGR